MRLKISKSKNTTLFYIIKDYTKNGKRSTKIVKRIGNLDDVKIMAGNTDYMAWLKDYVKQYNEEHCKSETIIIKKNNKKLISMNNKISFNVGYLFLKKLYNQLKLNNICYKIQDKYKFQFDLNEILSYLVYARIIYPSSKLETFRQCQNFIEQPKFKLHDEYKALNYDEDLIKEEEKYDGYYALTTNLIGDINQILKIVKGRWEIEESFRIMKSDFLARPVNLSREDRIKAHFMTCFISLFIYRLLEKKLNYKFTTSQVLETLRGMNVLEIKGDGYIPEYIRTDITDELHELFNFRTDYEINTYKDFKKIFDTIN